jgi:hypothetical protein
MGATVTRRPDGGMSKALLILIVSLFLSLIGGGIWKRACVAVAPPIYDPIGYYCRARLVWDALEKGDLHGILNGPMAARPPGTAFILYPFGFRASVHSFLFRAVFAPILIWALALSIPIATQVGSWHEALAGSALIVGLTSMPLFYHFEINDTFIKAYNVVNQWGLVDTLEAAIAGLAISLLCFGISKRSVKWCVFGWFVAALSLFIKPSGLLVMMTFVGISTVEFVILFMDRHSNRTITLKLGVKVFIIGFCIFGMGLWQAFSSEYLSREVITQAVKASQILISIRQGGELFGLFALFVVPVLGWWWFCPGVFYTASVALEAIQSIARRKWSAASLRFLAAGLIAVSAVCWWIFLAGQEQRYLFPFLLMVIAWFIPEVFQRIRGFSLPARGAVIGYCFAPAVLLGGMLWSKQPSMIFQQLIGVNLSTGGYGAEVKQGEWLFAESEKMARPLNLYSLGTYGVGVVEMIDWVKSAEKKTLPERFVVKRPLNWVDTPGLRTEDLLHTDFFLLEDIRTESFGEGIPVSSWSEEVERFKQFAYLERGRDKNGLELVSDGRVKILRVADTHKFSEALYAWANSIHWADGFGERNRAFLEKSSNE